jgi:hypothetical protein
MVVFSTYPPWLFSFYCYRNTDAGGRRLPPAPPRPWIQRFCAFIPYPPWAGYTVPSYLTSPAYIVVVARFPTATVRHPRYGYFPAVR